MKRNRSSYHQGYRAGRDLGHTKGWQEGFQHGYETTLSNLSPYYRKVLIVTPSLELPSLQIVALQPLEHLRLLGILEYTVCLEHELHDDLISAHELILFLRCAEPGALSYLNLASELGKRTVYAIDDHFIELPESTSVAPYYLDAGRREAYVQFLSLSHIVKVGSPFFADHIIQNYNPRVANIPDSFDFAQAEQGNRQIRNDGYVVIGYEGTVKEEDFEPVVPALLRILNEYRDRVKLEFQGYAPAILQGVPGVSHVELNASYRDYIKILYETNWDIGLAPLADHLFNNCKTNNKMREYSACGIVPLCSDSVVYRPWIEHGKNGWLTEHSVAGWYGALKQLIEQPSLRATMREEAQAQAKEIFSIELCAERWLTQILSKEAR